MKHLVVAIAILSAGRLTAQQIFPVERVQALSYDLHTHQVAGDAVGQRTPPQVAWDRWTMNTTSNGRRGSA